MTRTLNRENRTISKMHRFNITPNEPFNVEKTTLRRTINICLMYPFTMLRKKFSLSIWWIIRRTPEHLIRSSFFCIRFQVFRNYMIYR